MQWFTGLTKEKIHNKQAKLLIFVFTSKRPAIRELAATIDMPMIVKLVELQQRFGISPSGEGGEIETTVLDASLFKKKNRSN
ncbi:MAG: hypothetical protein NWE98_04485 [Candidatus Bathyarchaeota archaeon]|nr:hypothetical protein [Candidatus Bathyarchaeota archaeon]